MRLSLEREKVEHCPVTFRKLLDHPMDNARRDICQVRRPAVIFLLSVAELTLINDRHATLSIPQSLQALIYGDLLHPGFQRSLSLIDEPVQGREYLHEGVLEDVTLINPRRKEPRANGRKEIGITIVQQLDRIPIPFQGFFNDLLLRRLHL